MVKRTYKDIFIPLKMDFKSEDVVLALELPYNLNLPLLLELAEYGSMANQKGRQGKVRRWVSRIGGGGRVVVPAQLRGALGLKTGDRVVFEAIDDLVTFKPHVDVVRELQKKYGQRWKSPEFSTDAFLAERKAMWGEE